MGKSQEAIPQSFIDQIEELHEIEKFTPLDPRGCARRISPIAEEYDLNLIGYRGSVEMANISAPHYWVQHKDIIIDVAYPIGDKTFKKFLVAYIGVLATRTELENIAKQTPFHARTIGSAPEGVRYFGEPVIFSRDQVITD